MTRGGKAPVGAAQRVPASGGVGVASRRESGDAGRRLVGPPERAPAGRQAVHSAKGLSGGVHRALHDRRIGRERRTGCGRRHGSPGQQRRQHGPRRRKTLRLPTWKPKRLTVEGETAGYNRCESRRFPGPFREPCVPSAAYSMDRGPLHQGELPQSHSLGGSIIALQPSQQRAAARRAAAEHQLTVRRWLRDLARR
jgi:hypothetical protein